MLLDALKDFWPLLVIQFGLQIIAFINLAKREHVRFNNKWIWVLIIFFGNLLGPIFYFIFRGEEHEPSSED